MKLYILRQELHERNTRSDTCIFSIEDAKKADDSYTCILWEAIKKRLTYTDMSACAYQSDNLNGPPVSTKAAEDLVFKQQ